VIHLSIFGKRVIEVESSCRLLIVPLFRCSSRFESLILSHHSRFTCKCNKEDINDDADDDLANVNIWQMSTFGKCCEMAAHTGPVFR